MEWTEAPSPLTLPALSLSCSQLFGEPDADNDVSPETEEGEDGEEEGDPSH